jgi:hypothetical protein
MNFDLFDIMKSQNIPASTVSVKSSSTIPRHIIRKLKINNIYAEARKIR